MKILKKAFGYVVVLGLFVGLVVTSTGQNLAPGDRITSILTGLFTTDGTDVTLTSGVLLLPAGSAGDPAMAWSDDDDGTGTGLFRSAADEVAAAINGINRVRMGSYGVRIGTVGSAAVPAFSFDADTNTGIWRSASDQLSITAGGLTVVVVNRANIAGAGADLVTISSTLGIMDSDDTVRGLLIDILNVDHTGTANFVNLLEIDAIAGDAHSNLNAILIGALTGTAGAASEIETAINIGAGWDYSLSILADGSATDDNITLGASQTADAQLYFDGADLVFDLDGAIANGILANIGNDTAGGAAFTVQNAGLANKFLFIGSNTSNAGFNIFEIEVTSVIATDGSDVITMLELDWNETDWATDTETLYGINIDAITQDAQGSYYALTIGSSWGRDINLEDGTALITWANAGNLTIQDTGGTTQFRLTDQVVGADADIMRLIHVVGAMNGSDTYKGLFIDLTNGAHTGITNVLAGIEIDSITGDAQARETGIIVESGYDVSISTEGAIFQRENFQQGFRKQLASDFSAATDTDTSVNIVLGTNGVNFEYREEVAKTTSSFVLDNAGAIDISADNGTGDNEGVEFMLGSSQTTTSGYLIAGTDQLCFTVNAKVTLVAGTDQFVIGWRENAAYVGDNLYVAYAEYAVLGINNVDGSIFALSETATGPDTGTDDSDTNWANGETKTLKVCIDGAGLTHHYLDGTIVAEDDGANPNDFAMTAATNMVPFVSYLGISGTDAAILINWWEITAN